MLWTRKVYGGSHVPREEFGQFRLRSFGCDRLIEPSRRGAMVWRKPPLIAYSDPFHVPFDLLHGLDLWEYLNLL